jgi:signal transduction histidine kinase/DNA-binding response OmpR family regulator
MMQCEQKANILLVDDHQENLFALEIILESLNQNLVCAASGEEALKRLLKEEYAVILMDVQMPGMDGFEAAALIRDLERSKHTPIIFLTASNASEDNVFQGYSLGAVDYIIKPIMPDILRAKVAVFVDLFKKTDAFKKQQEKEAAAEVMQKRLAFLAETSEILAASLDYETTLANMARMVVPTLADCCFVDIIQDDGSLRQMAMAHVDPEKEQLARKISRNLSNGNGNGASSMERVLQNGRAEIYLASVDFEGDKLFHELMPSSYMIVPLIARNRGLGAISFISSESERLYGAADLALAENIASRAALAIDNARLYRKAQEASRLKDEFLATISHELRTPLTAMLGWTRLLRSGKLDGPCAQQAMDTIERNVKTQAQLIDDLLDISRIITGKLHLDARPIELIPVIQAAIDAVRPAADAKEIKIATRLDPWTGPVSGDPIRLQQVIWNLLSNAIKFTPKGGNAEIQLERVNASITISVRDTGKGINPEFLPYVFDRFRQADSTSTREHGGLGLGLAIARHLTEMHGGSIHVESDGLGQGATFTVKLPAMPPRSEANVIAQSLAGINSQVAEFQSTLAGLRVMIIDDEPDMRELLSLSLTQCGAEVKACGSADEALKTLAQWWPNVLVCDIAMPGKDGYELIRAVRSLETGRGKRTPAVALTAYAKVEDRMRALAAGFQMHVPKPIEPTELAAVIANLAQWVENV